MGERLLGAERFNAQMCTSQIYVSPFRFVSEFCFTIFPWFGSRDVLYVAFEASSCAIGSELDAIASEASTQHSTYRYKTISDHKSTTGPVPDSIH